MKTQNLLVALPLLIAASLPVQAATNGKTLPGAACQPLNKDQVFGASTSGVLFNTGTATLTVICPIVRDTIAANSSNGISSASVQVIDNNNNVGDPRVTCVLESRTTAFGLVESLSASSGSGASATAQTLGAQGQYANLASGNGGFYYFRCSIPPVQVVSGQSRLSALIMYRWDETE